jgi:integrase/recombinase XerD
MKTVSTFSVILICRPGKNKINEGLIYARISINGEQREISLKEKIALDQWNADKQQVEGRTPPTKALNTHLDNVLFKLKNITAPSLTKNYPLLDRVSKMLI